MALESFKLIHGCEKVEEGGYLVLCRVSQCLVHSFIVTKMIEQ